MLSVNVNESFQLSSSPMESSNGPDSTDGLPSIDFSDSPPSLPTICTDVNVVPEHERNELQQSISNLEGKVFENFQFRVSSLGRFASGMAKSKSAYEQKCLLDLAKVIIFFNWVLQERLHS